MAVARRRRVMGRGGLPRFAFRDRHRSALRGRRCVARRCCPVRWTAVRSGRDPWGRSGSRPGHEKTPASRRGSRWFSVVPALPPRSSVLLPGAGNQAKKAVQPQEIAGDDDRDMTTILPVDQAHVRLRGGPSRRLPFWFGRVYEATIDCATRPERPEGTVVAGRSSSVPRRRSARRAGAAEPRRSAASERRVGRHVGRLGTQVGTNVADRHTTGASGPWTGSAGRLWRRFMRGRQLEPARRGSIRPIACLVATLGRTPARGTGPQGRGPRHGEHGPRNRTPRPALPGASLC
jgi:hypothetical protein